MIFFFITEERGWAVSKSDPRTVLPEAGHGLHNHAHIFRKIHGGLRFVLMLKNIGLGCK